MRTAHWVILAFVLIAAAGSRVYRCAAQPLSYDELDSMETAAGRGLEHLDLQRDVPLGKLAVMTRLAGGRHIWDVPANMQQDMHPPLYFVMLRLWLDCFGDSDVAARSMSIVFGTLGVLLIFDLGRLMGGPA
ncbi:MAG TPA: glycosyltransferase family 39 protein, partial [Tepidisphaeraceae bacterium]|nr:glycosyltransferase family 39 protein [Tepidisphaeraceae bacterium]